MRVFHSPGLQILRFSGCQSFFTKQLHCRFEIAVVCLGVNEITTETGVPVWIETYGALLDLLRGLLAALVARFIL